jgi:hypothetical protein
MMAGRRPQQAALPRGLVAGSSERQPDEGGDDGGRVEDRATSRPLELVSEPRDADATRGQWSGEAAGREAEGDDERLVAGSSESVAAQGKDATAAEAVVSVHLDAELAGRDEGRAQRYVATVRPAMAALRYVRPVAVDDRRRPKTEEGGSLQTSDGKSKTEEGGSLQTSDGESKTEEGGTPAIDGETATADGVALGVGGDDNGVDAYSIARIRKVAKQEKRAAKRLRATRAERRRHLEMTGVEDVDAVVTALGEERRTRRERQQDEARGVLAQRRRLQEGVRLPDDGQVAKVRLVQQRAMMGDAAVGDDTYSALAEDGLPTATMDVEGEQLLVKLDSGARYSVAGTDRMLRGERVRRPAPVDVVEGIGGFLLDVIGVWTFHMRNVYGQAVTVEACIIDGCTDEFLIGVDFLQHHKAIMDFEKNELRYDERREQVVVPFRADKGADGAKVAVVLLVSRVKLRRSTVTPVEVAVAAPDGEQDVFVPLRTCGAVMMAATVTTSRNGKAPVPLINVQGSRAKLPRKKELGVWIPPRGGHASAGVERRTGSRQLGRLVARVGRHGDATRQRERGASGRGRAGGASHGDPPAASLPRCVKGQGRLPARDSVGGGASYRHWRRGAYHAEETPAGSGRRHCGRGQRE